MFFRKKIDIDQYVEEAYDKDILLVDVRSKEEFESGHIAKSINIPLDKINALDVDKDKTVYVFCRSGARSEHAKNQLIQLGYQNVKNIGGVIDSKKELK